jgi:hypothetical protein
MSNDSISSWNPSRNRAIYCYIAGTDDGLELSYQSDLLTTPYAELLHNS